MCVSSWRLATSLDPCVNVQALHYQLETSDEVVTVVFTGFELEVMDDEVRETYIDELDANDIQTDKATQRMWAIAVFRGVLTIPLRVERYKCGSSLQQFDSGSSWCLELLRASFSFPRGMFSKVDVRFASTVLYMHFAVAMLIRQSCWILLIAVPCTDKI